MSTLLGSSRTYDNNQATIGPAATIASLAAAAVAKCATATTSTRLIWWGVAIATIADVIVIDRQSWWVLSPGGSAVAANGRRQPHAEAVATIVAAISTAVAAVAPANGRLQ